MTFSKVLGTGSYLPEKVLTNHDLEKIVDTNDEWIVSRTGIKQRHVAGDNETASSMAEVASRHALDMAGLKANEIDMIIVATTTPDHRFPGAACHLQQRLGIGPIPAFDLNSAACAGFIYALTIADQFIRTNTHKRVLIVGSELMTRVVDWQDRSTCVLFGDGAGAMVLGASEEPGIISTRILADGAHKDILYLPTQDSNDINTEKAFMKMEGNRLFRLAVNVLGHLFDETLQQSGLQKSDIKWLVAHQANIRIIAAMAKKLGLSMDNVPMAIDRHANTSAASIPLVFDELVRSNKLNKGDHILFEAIGGGLMWGSAILKY